ncbi:MAG: TspO/MBR family protein [Pseudomonadota bacterium]
MKDSHVDPASRDFATTPLGDALTLLGWIFLLVGLGAGSGVLFGPDEWYAGLLKPTFNPPSWLFGPVWTALYASMAIALWWMRRDRAADPAQRRRAGRLFAVQFVLNLIWTPLFFGLRSPGLAFVDICLLWVALLATMLAFGRVRPLAGYLLLPYLLWISFALVLNGTIWLMNA